MYYIYCMYFVIRFHNWGGNLEYYDEFDFSETAGISDEKKLYYIELYDNLLRGLDERKIENKDMIRR